MIANYKLLLRASDSAVGDLVGELYKHIPEFWQPPVVNSSGEPEGGFHCIDFSVEPAYAPSPTTIGSWTQAFLLISTTVEEPPQQLH